MIIPDVNVWIPILRPDVPEHDRYRDWLSSALADNEPVGISELIFSGVLRVLTNSRIFREPSSTQSVISALEVLRAAPRTRVVAPGDHHWSIFIGLCTAVNARGNLVADAFHAALAIESDATFITMDRDFSRFPGLAVASPFG